MTVHFQQSLATAFHLQHSQLQDLYHLSSDKALIPALKRTLRNLIPAEYELTSGHLIQENISSPYLDLIIFPKKSQLIEKVGEWGLVDASEAVCLVHQLEQIESDDLEGFLSLINLSPETTTLSFSAREFLIGKTENLFQQIISLFDATKIAVNSPQIERTLVLDKKVDKASQVASSVNGIAIPYKEPLKKNSYSPESKSPEPEQTKTFDPGKPQGPDGNFLVHLAILNGDLPAVSEYLQMGGDTELKNKHGDSLLHLAAQHNQHEIAELLLISEAETNSRNYVYGSPLHMAVREGHTSMIDLLVKHGAELEVRNNRGKTPLHLAAIHGRKDCATRLLKHGADIHAKMEKSMVPIHLAAWYGQSDIAQALLDLGADIDAINEDGNTALHFAAFNGQVRIIKVLMGYGANPSIKNNSGETYLDGVNEGYSGEMIKILD